jgi:beta-lactamase superfamily II metal-dependent hydrolase
MSARWWLVAVGALAFVVPLRGEEKRGLTITFIDVEGGAATLIVTPEKESVLIDCGDANDRDAPRIQLAVKEAGLKAIDHLLITHWHTDHYGGVENLAKLVPIRNFYDRGIPGELAEDPKRFPVLIAAYKKVTGGKSKILKAGDTLPLRSAPGTPALRLDCLCASGVVVPDRPGAAENEAARDHTPMAVDTSDNAKSLGFLLHYGGFRFLDLGDLTWNVEHKLVWPTDKIGLIDVYQSTHHGLEISNNPAVIRTVQPRVAVFNNGPKKGGHPTVIATLRRVPGLQAIYQLHRNLTATPEENTGPEYIANADEKCQGEAIYLSMAPDARSYTIRVGAKGKERTYKVRQAD